MNRNLGYVALVLVLVAAFLGYKIYAQKSEGRAPMGTSQPIATGTPDVKTTPSASSDILKTPGSDASLAERDAYLSLVLASAVKADSIDISACSPKPVAVSVTLGADVSLVNKDAVAHTVTFDEKTSFTVGPKSTKVIEADFSHGPGIYGYICDQSTSPVGLVLVNQ